MTERSKEIAMLYSRAHLGATGYWDFSASRKQVRGQFRQPAGSQPSEQPPFTPPVVLEPRQAQEPSNLSESPQPRQGIVTRWYALHSFLNPAELAEEPASLPITPERRPPLLAVVSLAGGVGKTCLVATLGRALSALGERVLLADTAACGLLPFYFGSREFRPGVVRTFSPPGSKVSAEGDAPVQVLNLQAERFSSKGRDYDPLLMELLREGRGANRILVDVATADRDVTSRLLFLRPTVLVPVLPDMSSVASLGLLQVLLAEEEGGPEATHYLLNQFDASSPLHVDVRALLQHQLGDQLLPFVVRRSPAVSEGLAEGMTVFDYAPDSEAAEDYRNLANWLRSFAAPAVQTYGGARWSER